ncbi:hypothetical protein AB0393_38735 [Streptomyces cyaneofuscatus]|uniref:hypothetical protein n=1 Tax=Streptomyces cyaneofuscatus TaxID=66883 RepID=UPI00344B7212
MDDLRPTQPADIGPLIDWNDGPFDEVPDQLRPFVVNYYVTTAGIPDCFDGFDEVPLADHAVSSSPDGVDPAAAVRAFVQAHLGMLDTWYGAIDSLDAGVRGAHGLPAWAERFLQGAAQELFLATSALNSAVMTHHHGSAGPRVSEAYGFAYALSNGTVRPF